MTEAGLALEAAYVTLLGLMLGSFMNVCIYRLPRGLSPVRPRSGCPNCGHMLAWYENVPVVSYLVLRGRCRKCRVAISPMYPIIEAITGAAFLAAYLWYGPSALLIVRLAFAWAMIALFVIDYQHQILPNVITIPGIVLGILANVLAVVHDVEPRPPPARTGPTRDALSVHPSTVTSSRSGSRVHSMSWRRVGAATT